VHFKISTKIYTYERVKNARKSRYKILVIRKINEKLKKLKYFFRLNYVYTFIHLLSNSKIQSNAMIEILLKNLQVGKTYYIHQVKDEDTHSAISRKYKAVCTVDYCFSDWYEFGFDNVKGINTEDIVGGMVISLDDDRWGLYKYYLCEGDEIIERIMIDSALRQIIGDPYFRQYS